MVKLRAGTGSTQHHVRAAFSWFGPALIYDGIEEMPGHATEKLAWTVYWSKSTSVINRNSDLSMIQYM